MAQHLFVRFVRQFLVSWIGVLDSVPESSIVKHLPEFLDPLFNILDDSSPEIYTMCENLLGEFLANIIKKPDCVDFAGMINILIVHSQVLRLGDIVHVLFALRFIVYFVSVQQRPAANDGHHLDPRVRVVSGRGDVAVHVWHPDRSVTKVPGHHGR